MDPQGVRSVGCARKCMHRRPMGCRPRRSGSGAAAWAWVDPAACPEEAIVDLAVADGEILWQITRHPRGCLSQTSGLTLSRLWSCSPRPAVSVTQAWGLALSVSQALTSLEIFSSAPVNFTSKGPERSDEVLLLQCAGTHCRPVVRLLGDSIARSQHLYFIVLQ